MSGLLHTLNVGSESLFATRQGVDTTSHNIANAQKEGYSRQRVNLETRPPLEKHGTVIGNGAFVGSISRSHDKLVESQLVDATAQQRSSEAKYAALEQLEGIFNPEYGNSISQEISVFFENLNTLSSFPEELTTRTSVFESGKNVAASFRRIDTEVERVRHNLNENLQYSAQQANGILQEISKLNIQISNMESGIQSEANDLRDKREGLVRELATMMNVKYYEDPRGMMTIRGPADTLLVEAGMASTFSVKANANNDNLYDLVVSGFDGNNTRNVTDRIYSGSLQGIIEARDVTARTLLDKNNQMAMTFANSFNAIHREGYGIGDFREVKGRNFFEEITDLKTAAQKINISSGIESSVHAISAASSPNAPGDNVIVNQLVTLRTQNLLADGSANFTDFYANYVGDLGLNVIKTKHTSEANDILKSNMEKLKSSISGVSLDEEAANMIKWQTAFTASSKVITTVDEMLETVLSLKR